MPQGVLVNLAVALTFDELIGFGNGPQEEVNKLLCSTLSQRERDIVRLYYGLEKESLTWEAISRQ